MAVRLRPEALAEILALPVREREAMRNALRKLNVAGTCSRSRTAARY